MIQNRNKYKVLCNAVDCCKTQKNIDMEHKDERKKLQSIGFREKMLGWLTLQEITIQIMLYLVAVTPIY